MVGGVFERRNSSTYEVLHTVTEIPPDGWTEVSVDFGEARSFRYRSPDNGYGNVAEIEFCRAGAEVIAAASRTPGSASGKNDDTFRAVFDGDTSTFFDAPQPNGAYVEFDTGNGTPSGIPGGTPAGYDRLTVTGANANASGDYLPGQRVNVYVTSLPPGQYFAGWEGFTSILDNPNSRITNATIPGIGVDMWLAATFKPVPPGSYILDVINGSGAGAYPAGTVVKVTADPPAEGMQFSGWGGDVAILADPLSPTTTAIVPSTNVEVYPSYTATQKYTLTVNNGTGDGSYSSGSRVVVSADPPGQGRQFEIWDGDTAILDNFTSPTTGAIIPLRDVTITATYSDLPTYTVTVTNGTGSGNYAAGAQVAIVADAPPAGQQFAGWTGDVSFANASSPSTTFTMPSFAVAVTANYGVVSTTDVVRYYPRAGATAKMIGGVFEGTNGDPVTGPYTAIHTITTNPPVNWTTVNVSLGNYRYLRYLGPNGSYGNVAEIEFYRAGVKLTGMGFGTAGSWNNVGNTFAKALDGNVQTYFDGPVSDGNYVGIDAGNSIPPVTFPVTVLSGTGSGNYAAGAQVSIVADAPPAGQQFAGWTGNVSFVNASSPSTTFAMPASAVAITANYSAVSATDEIRYYPRAGAAAKMIGGVFEGTNGDPVTGPYTAIHTITTNPPVNWTTVNVSLGNYRYLRYLGPNGSYGNVAEIEFYRAGVKLTGMGFGTAGSWNNVGNTFAKALDGSVQTYFDGPVSDGNYVGIDAGNDASSQ